MVIDFKFIEDERDDLVRCEDLFVEIVGIWDDLDVVLEVIVFTESKVLRVLIALFYPVLQIGKILSHESNIQADHKDLLLNEILRFTETN